MVEIFTRLLKNLDVRFVDFIGDRDCKTYSGIVAAAPYGKTTMNKKECIGHVQKRMGMRLRTCKKRNKGLGGKGKLIDKVIDRLAAYSGKAIHNTSNSIENMKIYFWATFDHYNLTTKKSSHS